MVYNMKFQSQNIGQFTIEDLITLSKQKRQKFPSPFTSTQQYNNQIEKGNDKIRYESQLLPFRVHRSLDISEATIFNKRFNHQESGRNETNSVIGITSPMYIDRREANRKIIIGKSEHGKSSQFVQSQHARQKNLNQYLKKGKLQKHLLQKYLSSKQFRKFHKSQSSKFENRINNRKQIRVRSKVRKQKQLECQFYCGLFDVKCCRCCNKEKLDCFNEKFQQILKKRGIWYNYKITNLEKEAQYKIKSYITQKLTEGFFTIKKQNFIETIYSNTKLKQNLQKVQEETMQYIESYLKDLKISRKEKLNLLDWSYKISEVFKKQLVKNAGKKLKMRIKNSEGHEAVQQEQSNQLIMQKVKKIQKDLFSFERYKEDQGKKGYDDNYKSNMRGNDETKIIFKFLSKRNTHTKMKKKKKEKSHQQENNRQNNLGEQSIEKMFDFQQKQNIDQDQVTKKISFKKSKISSRLSTTLTSDQHKRDSKKRQNEQRIERIGTSNSYRQQSKRSKASGFRVSSTDQIAIGNILQSIMTQNDIETRQRIDAIQEDISDYSKKSTQFQHEFEEIQANKENTGKQIYNQQRQEQEQIDEEFDRHFLSLYKKLKRTKRRNGMINMNSWNRKGSDLQDPERKQFQAFKNEIKMNKIIKKNLEEILKKSGCEDAIIDQEEDGMLNALRKIGFIQQLSESGNLGDAMKQFLKKYIQIHQKNRNIKQSKGKKNTLQLSQKQNQNKQIKCKSEENCQNDDSSQYHQMGIKDFMKYDLDQFMRSQNVRLFDLKKSQIQQCEEQQSANFERDYWKNYPIKRSFGRQFILQKIFLYRDKKPDYFQFREFRKNNELKIKENGSLKDSQYLIQTKI